MKNTTITLTFSSPDDAAWFFKTAQGQIGNSERISHTATAILLDALRNADEIQSSMTEKEMIYYRQ